MNIMNIVYRQSCDCLEGSEDCLKGVCDGAMWLDDGIGWRVWSGGVVGVVWWRYVLMVWWMG